MKSFFKEFVETKKKIDYKVERYLMSKNDLTCTCFDALEKYLNQYTWARHEDEKICFDFCYDGITLQEVAKINEISYNTLRSLNSRVSTRLYYRFGYNFAEVILGDDAKKQHKLIARCDASVDEYKLKEHYPASLLSSIKMQIDDTEIYSIDRFKITRKDLVVLKFMVDYDVESILGRLELIDSERLALICHILSNKKYYDERCEILGVMHSLQNKMTAEYFKTDAEILSGVKVAVPKDKK